MAILRVLTEGLQGGQGGRQLGEVLGNARSQLRSAAIQENRWSCCGLGVLRGRSDGVCAEGQSSSRAWVGGGRGASVQHSCMVTLVTVWPKTAEATPL